MRLALGIDAAWTVENPSGVALCGETDGGWRLLAVESSYRRFLDLAAGRMPVTGHAGEAPDVEALLEACRALAGRTPDLVAVDMPMARTPITGRRASDLAISRTFGAAKAATHSPSALRPGRLSDAMRADFERAGFALCCAGGLRTPGVIEVYPHAALLALTGDKVRLTYKAGKTTIYWPGAELVERATRLREVWLRIVAALQARIEGVAAALPPPAAPNRGRALKAHEDKLDAVVCAWVAIMALDGNAQAYGDGDSAIWVPTPAQP